MNKSIFTFLCVLFISSLAQAENFRKVRNGQISDHSVRLDIYAKTGETTSGDLSSHSMDILDHCEKDAVREGLQNPEAPINAWIDIVNAQEQRSGEYRVTYICYTTQD